METKRGGKNNSLELFMSVQTKNTIKEIFFLTISVLLFEGVMGLGVFWPFLLNQTERKNSFWLAFFCGVLFSLFYNQKIGLMSLFLVTVMVGMHLMVGGGGKGKIIMTVSLIANFVFDRLFGLNWSLWEGLVILVVCLLFAKDLESQETIKINFK
jgi:hypothetical protein